MHRPLDSRPPTVSVPHLATGFALAACLTAVTLGQGGDDSTTATPLGLNTPTTGTTTGYNDDSDEVCPYAGSTSPDVYYAYTPTVSHSLTVDLCESAYDTKTYVYDDALQLLSTTRFGEPSCNDDACSSSGGEQFRSMLSCIPVEIGAQYYVVVDGFGGESGDYTIELRASEDAGVDCAEVTCADCPPFGVPEGEPCNEGGDDTINGGCFSPDQMAFSPIDCEGTVCGTVYYDGELRDTDWYKWRQYPPHDRPVYWEVEAEFEAVIGRVENNGIDCCDGVTAFAEVAVSSFGCEPGLQTFSVVSPGTYYFFVAPAFTEVISCAVPGDPVKYTAFLSCETSVSCRWDLDSNGEVDFQDLLKLLAEWGDCPSGPGCDPPCPWDFDENSTVDFQDLLKLLAVWGPCSVRGDN